MSDYVLILGATSGIARAIAHELAKQESSHHNLILASRDLDETKRIAKDLYLRHAIDVDCVPFDAENFESHVTFFNDCVIRAGDQLGGVILCYGNMVDQEESQKSFELIRRMIDVNYSSAVSILNLAAEYFQKKQGGFICAMSSVAGDRGRASNYLYGSTKAALSAYLEGLRAWLAGAGVQVLTVKPGPVDTVMTWGVAFSGPLASPERVATDVSRAIRNRKNVIYSPWFWRPIMALIRLIPQRLYHRLKL